MFTTPAGGLVLRQTIAKLVKGAATRCGIDADLGTHAGRRTVVTTLFVDGDEAFEDIARFVGHAKPSTTAGYVKRLGRRPGPSPVGCGRARRPGCRGRTGTRVRNQVARSQKATVGATGLTSRRVEWRMPTNRRPWSGALRSVRAECRADRVCGAGWIRTHGSRRIGSFQDCCLRPLGHRSRAPGYPALLLEDLAAELLDPVAGVAPGGVGLAAAGGAVLAGGG